MRIAIITAGGAGMYCGSCMHDNTWTRSLRDAGADVILLPTYTPIRVDEPDQSSREVYLGGINLYLDHKSSLWRRLPKFLTSWLDHPSVIRLATRFGVSNDAAKLGDMTLAMLAGENGPQARGIESLTQFLVDDFKPDVIVFSNALLVGVLRHLRLHFDGQILCMLQGDDVFLEALPEPYRTQAREIISERAAEFDGFLTHSDYYRQFMSEYLSLPIERFHHIPLGIDLQGHDGTPSPPKPDQFTIGYFARICPEKGIQNLPPALRLLKETHPHARVVAGGYLEKRQEKWLKSLKTHAADLGDSFQYVGSPASHAEKVALLRTFDVLTVPTDYHEPKGLPILEAMANGIPVIQPAHGAFPELIEKTGGGLLVQPGDPAELAAAWARMIDDATLHQELASNGQRGVREHYSATALAERSMELFRELIDE